MKVKSKNIILFYSLFFVIEALKFLYVYSALHIKFSPLIYDLSCLLSLTAFLSVVELLSPYALLFFAVIIDFFITGVLVGNLGYFRYYGTLVPLNLFRLIKAVPRISDATINLVKFYEWAFLLSIPFMGLLWFKSIFRKNRELEAPKKKKKIITRTVFFLVALSVTSISLIKAKHNKETLKSARWLPPTDTKFVSVTGIFAFYSLQFMDTVKSKQVDRDKLQEDLKKYLWCLHAKNDENIPEEFKKLRGRYKGKNVIILLLEAFENFPVGEKIGNVEVTPNLNSLLSNSIYFSRFYSHISYGSTTDAEFAINNSLYPLSNDAVYTRYYLQHFRTLPRVLRENGYHTYAFHANVPHFWNRAKAYLFQGIESFFSKRDFHIDEVAGMGLSDASFLRQVAEKLASLPQPFYTLIITLTSHYPYFVPKGYSPPLFKEIKNSRLRNYLQSINYVDYSIGIFLRMLKKTGLMKKSILIITGDHFAHFSNDKNEQKAIAEEIKNWFLRDKAIPARGYNVPLLITLPDIDKEITISHVRGHKDIMPTVLYLLDISDDRGYRIGLNLFSEEREGIYIPFQSIVVSDDFIAKGNDEHIECTPINGASSSFDVNSCEKTFRRAVCEFSASQVLIKGDFIGRISGGPRRNIAP